MYGFVTHTWNPISGRCPIQYSYCYMDRWKLTKPMALDPKKLNTNLGEGNVIFVGSGCDMWHESVPWTDKDKVISQCLKYPKNTYLFQSKVPENFITHAEILEVERNDMHRFIFCTTIESNRIANVGERLWPLVELQRWGFRVMVTIEPMMDFDHIEFVNIFSHFEQSIQINIGADSGHNELEEPDTEKLIVLIRTLHYMHKVHLKPNLKRLLGDRWQDALEYTNSI